MPNSPFTWGPQGPQSLQNGSVQLKSGMFLQNDGPKNYLTYSDAETNATTGWSLGNVALTSKFPSGTPTFGSGASGNLSLGVSSSSPIAGTYSYTYTSSAATTAGNFLASDAFTIDSADQGKVLTFKFYYTPSSNPTNGNWSGTSSNSFGVAIYDVTTGGSTGWIMPAGVWSMTQNSGVGIATGTFQTNTTSTQYRIVVFNANASSGAITLKFDRFFLGPQTIPIGPVVTDWVDFPNVAAGTLITGTTSNPSYGVTVSKNKAQWRRVGDSMEIIWNYVHSGGGGSAGSGAYLFSLPPGYSIDLTKVTSYTIAPTVSGLTYGSTNVGHAYGTITSIGNSTYSGGAGVFVYSATKLSFNTFATAVSATYPWGSNNMSFSAVDLNFSFTAKVPIAGWSSQVQQSNDTDTKVIAASYYVSSSYSVTGSTSVNFDKMILDNTASVTAPSAGAGTWKFTAPVSGIYQVSSNISTNSGAPVVYLYKNGVINQYFSYTNNTIASAFGASVLVQLNAGDYIDLRFSGTATVNGGTFSSTTLVSTIHIQRLSGPAVVAASESVNARFTDTSGAAIPNPGPAVFKYTTKDFDSHNAYNTSTGIYTAPVTGKYLITAKLRVATGGGNYITLFIYKNGVANSTAQFFCGSSLYSSIITDEVQCNAGDSIAIYAAGNGGSGDTGSGGGCSFAITRVGN